MEDVIDVTDETPESETSVPWAPIILATAAFATGAAVTAKVLKTKRNRSLKLEVVEIDTDNPSPAPPAES